MSKTDNVKPGLVAKGIRRLRKPQSVQVGLPPNWDPPALNILHKNGDTESIPISKKVAEVLIAYGMSCEG